MNQLFILAGLLEPAVGLIFWTSITFLLLLVLKYLKVCILHLNLIVAVTSELLQVWKMISVAKFNLL